MEVSVPRCMLSALSFLVLLLLGIFRRVKLCQRQKVLKVLWAVQQEDPVFAERCQDIMLLQVHIAHHQFVLSFPRSCSEAMEWGICSVTLRYLRYQKG